MNDTPTAGRYAVVPGLPLRRHYGEDIGPWLRRFIQAKEDNHEDTIHNVKADLTSLQQIQLNSLIVRFNDVIAPDEFGVGEVPRHLAEHKIHLIPGESLAAARSGVKTGTSWSQKEIEYFKRIIPELVKRNILRQATPAEARDAPFFIKGNVVAKPGRPDAMPRIVADFRELNANTSKPRMMLPKNEQLIQDFEGCRFFSIIDVTSAFWNIHLHPDSQSLTVTHTPMGAYVWLRMPMGLNGSPATMQEVMDFMLSNISRALGFMDDIIAGQITFDDHLKQLELIFSQLRTNNLKVRREKLLLAMKQVKAVGHIIREGGYIRADFEKIAAITRQPYPKTKEEMQCFLGMAGYWRNYIENYDVLATPLYAAASGRQELTLTEQEKQCVDKLKKAITQPHVLTSPDWTNEFVLVTDWCEQGVGAMLGQIKPEFEHDLEDGRPRVFPIAFISQACSYKLARSSSHRGECYAIWWAVNKFRYYLWGRHFSIWTDSKSVAYLADAMFKDEQVFRWAMDLQEYSFDIVHIKGITNVVADCVSRCQDNPRAPENNAYLRRKKSLAARKALEVQSYPEAQTALLHIIRDNEIRTQCVACKGYDQLWPISHYAKPSAGNMEDPEEDGVDLSLPCSKCDNTKGFRSMLICDGCETGVHYQCLPPDERTKGITSGTWLCPKCRPRGPSPDHPSGRDNVLSSLHDLIDLQSPLTEHPLDPYSDPDLIECLKSLAWPATHQPNLAILNRVLGDEEFRKLMRKAKRWRIHPASMPTDEYCWIQFWQLPDAQNQHPGRWVTNPPVPFRENLIRMYHNKLGHCGIENVRRLLGQHYRWRGFKKDLKAVIISCDVCQRRKMHATWDEAQPMRMPVTTALHTIHVDLAGPFPIDESHAVNLYNRMDIRKLLKDNPLPGGPSSAIPKGPKKKRNKHAPASHILIMVDSFTKLLELGLIIGKSSSTVTASFHKHWSTRYGYPGEIVCDSGSEFMGEFEQYATANRITIRRTRPHNPKANGKAETCVKSSKVMLSCAVDDYPRNYDELLPDVRMAYMARFHSAVGTTPFEMLTGRSLRLFPTTETPQSLYSKSFIQKALKRAERECGPPTLDPWEQLYFEDFARHMAKIDKAASGRLNAAADRYLSRQTSKMLAKDPSPLYSRPIRSGDMVLVRKVEKETGLKAFHSKRLGPYTVIKVITPTRLLLRGDNGTVEKPRDELCLFWTLNSAIREFGSAGRHAVKSVPPTVPPTTGTS
jgi:hypothetical protein